MLRTEEQERNGAAPGGTSGEGRASPLDSLSFHALEIAGRVSRLARVRAARARLRVSRTVFLVLGGIVLALVAAAASLAGVRLIVSGLTAGLTELAAGRTWLAELWSGLVLLALTALLLVWARAWSERRVLRDLERRHGDDQDRR